MIRIESKRGRVLPLLLVLTLFSAPLFALDLNQAKAQGLVKESKSKCGYIEEVKSTKDVKQLVKKINAARKAEYQKIAKKRGTSLQAVEKLACQKLVQ